jgi:4-amino-4-deoxy-L-arabinose transferase-like glycosyltransferase
MNKVKNFFNLIISDNEIYIFVIFFFLFILAFAKNEIPILPQHDDITHACIAKRMVETHNYIEMYEGKDVSFLKPPLYFWLEVLAFNIFGVNDYSTRFPSAILGFITILLGYFISKKLFGDDTSLLFLFIISTSFYFLKFAKQAMIDMPVAFTTTLAIYSFINLEFYNKKKYYFLFVISVASGYYFKAIQGLYPLFIVIFYFIVTNNLRKVFTKEFIFAVLGIFLLILIWAFPMYLKFGDSFLYSQCGIGPIIHRGIEGHNNKFYDPFLKLIGLNLPWGILNLYGFYILFKNFRDREKILVFSWFFVILFLLSVSKTFYLRYLIPLYIPYAIIGAVGLNSFLKNYMSLLKKIFFLIIFLVFISFLVLPIPKYYYKGTNYYEMYQTIKHLNIDKTKIIIYKERYYKLNQGLSYYSSLIPFEYFPTKDDLIKKNDPDYTYITDYESLNELLNDKEFQQKINILAFSKDKSWAIFKLKL